MVDIEEQKKIAILIDAENTPREKIPAILEELVAHGRIITKRAYGDFTSGSLRNWKNTLNENAILPVQQFSYTKGKNSSDSAMIIDAMDLLYTEKYDAFALVSSDSDFTKLSSRLRESQEFVFGVGQKKTPVSFVKACDDFIFIENLKDGGGAEIEKMEAKAQKKRAARKTAAAAGGVSAAGSKSAGGDIMTDAQFNQIYSLLTTASEKYADDSGWTLVSAAGSLFKRRDPGFDTRDFGFKKLSDLIAYLDDDFEMKSTSANDKMYRLKVTEQ